MVQAFFPTLARHARPARCLPPETARLTAAQLGVPAVLVTTIVTHASSSAAPLPGAHSVVLFSPKLTESRSDTTGLDEELASRGYIAIAVDHPYESAVIELPVAG